MHAWYSWADIFKTEPPLSPLRELHDPAVSAALDGLGAVASSAIYSVLLAYRASNEAVEALRRWPFDLACGDMQCGC